ncbi:hypothetical protein AKJ16_DCAP00268, partial [Drosera capensis]
QKRSRADDIASPRSADQARSVEAPASQTRAPSSAGAGVVVVDPLTSLPIVRSRAVPESSTSDISRKGASIYSFSSQGGVIGETIFPGSAVYRPAWFVNLKICHRPEFDGRKVILSMAVLRVSELCSYAENSDVAFGLSRSRQLRPRKKILRVLVGSWL